MGESDPIFLLGGQKNRNYPQFREILTTNGTRKQKGRLYFIFLRILRVIAKRFLSLEKVSHIQEKVGQYSAPNLCWRFKKLNTESKSKPSKMKIGCGEKAKLFFFFVHFLSQYSTYNHQLRLGFDENERIWGGISGKLINIWEIRCRKKEGGDLVMKENTQLSPLWRKIYLFYPE